MSTARIALAISSILADVSAAASARPSLLALTCLTLRTICSIEVDTSSTLPPSTEAVSLSSSPAAPSSRIELLESSTEMFRFCAAPATSITWLLIDTISSLACWIRRTCCSLASVTPSATFAIAAAVESKRSAELDKPITVARIPSDNDSNARHSSPTSSSASEIRPLRRSPLAITTAVSRKDETDLNTSPEITFVIIIAAAIATKSTKTKVGTHDADPDKTSDRRT